MADLDQHAISVSQRDQIKEQLKAATYDELDVYRSGGDSLTIQVRLPKTEVGNFLSFAIPACKYILGDKIKYNHSHSGKNITESSKKDSLMFIWVTL